MTEQTINVKGCFLDGSGSPIAGMSVYVTLNAESAFLLSGEQVSTQEKKYITDSNGEVSVTLFAAPSFDRIASCLLDIIATYTIRIPKLGITRLVAVPSTLSAGTCAFDDLIDAHELEDDLSDAELEELGLL